MIPPPTPPRRLPPLPLTSAPVDSRSSASTTRMVVRGPWSAASLAMPSLPPQHGAWPATTHPVMRGCTASIPPRRSSDSPASDRCTLWTCRFCSSGMTWIRAELLSCSVAGMISGSPRRQCTTGGAGLFTTTTLDSIPTATDTPRRSLIRKSPVGSAPNTIPSRRCARRGRRSISCCRAFHPALIPTPRRRATPPARLEHGAAERIR